MQGAFAEAIKRKTPGYGTRVLNPGDYIQDETTGKMTQVPLPAQPVGWGVQGYRDPQTGIVTPIQFADGTDASTQALGTFGSSTIDPTVEGYSTKTIPGTGGLTRSALDQKATFYITSGTQPPVGRGGAQGQQNSAIANRMAELDPTGNLAANKGQFKSLTSSLAKQQQYLDQTERAIRSADTGLQQLVNAFNGKVNVSQYPSVNAAANAVQAQLDPATIKAYKAGLQEVANEYTQVFSRGGQVTDAVRNRAQDIIDGNLSVPALQKVLDEIHQQGEIVIKSAKDQVQTINDQISGLAGGQSASSPTIAPSNNLPSPQTQQDFDALPKGAHYIDPDDGQEYIK